MNNDNCDHCRVPLDTEYLSDDWGGTCKRCMLMAEELVGEGKEWVYYDCCDYCNLPSFDEPDSQPHVVPAWTVEHFERHGQTIRLSNGSLLHQCVEDWANGGMSTLMMNSIKREQ